MGTGANLKDVAASPPLATGLCTHMTQGVVFLAFAQTVETI